MNTALQIISIQHELVLALGHAPDMKSMLQQFLRVCNSRLDLKSSHIFLYHNQDDVLCNKEIDNENIYLRHLISLPQQKNGQPWYSDNQLLQTVIDFEASENKLLTTTSGDSFFQYLKIIDCGVMVIECQETLNETLLNTLEPILERVKISCRSAINHDTLLREIEARKAAEEQIIFQATHDDITGLFNRREITRQIDEALKENHNSQQLDALICIGLNDFKSINDLLGHNIGDQVLRQVAGRLINIIPENYSISRFSGDEFIILLKQIKKEEIDKKAQEIIHSITKEIAKPFVIDGNKYSLSCSAGYDVLSDENPSANEHIKNADLAMYEAKHTGAANGLRYDIEMSEKLNKKISYSVELKRALEKNEFELHYQPQYGSNGLIIGAEALLRWNNPFRGYESPAIYIPIAEQSDLIIYISEWVLDRACRDIKALEQTNLPENFKKLSINISAKHLAEANFVDCIMSAIEKHKICKNHLAIEITESIMMGDVARSIHMLEDLRDMGVECSIDDFGTGYSSLTYLKQLPANLIKIDRAFVKDIHKDNDNCSIAEMIIGLGKNLNMDIIAEGVECQEEVDCLHKLGCHQFQGFFFCKPVPYDNLVELINKQCAQTNAS